MNWMCSLRGKKKKTCTDADTCVGSHSTLSLFLQLLNSFRSLCGSSSSLLGPALGKNAEEKIKRTEAVPEVQVQHQRNL